MNQATTLMHPEKLATAADTTIAASEPLAPGVLARMLFWFMDALYGQVSTLAKFRVLEVVARVPYIAWEQVGYIAITHTHATPRFAREIHNDVRAFRAQQDNEFLHLLIIEELLAGRGERQSLVRHRLIPQVMAWGFHGISWLLFVVHPRSSHALNAQFEDHAERAYLAYVADHPELEREPWTSDFESDYGPHETVADLLRSIAMDERRHKNESLERLETARFGTGRRS